MTLEELEKRTGINYDNASTVMQISMVMTCLELSEECKHERVETVSFDTVLVCLDCGKEEVIA